MKPRRVVRLGPKTSTLAAAAAARHPRGASSGRWWGLAAAAPGALLAAWLGASCAHMGAASGGPSGGGPPVARALFIVGCGGDLDGCVATPVACVAGGRWVGSRRACAAALPERLVLRGAAPGNRGPWRARRLAPADEPGARPRWGLGQPPAPPFLAVYVASGSADEAGAVAVPCAAREAAGEEDEGRRAPMIPAPAPPAAAALGGVAEGQRAAVVAALASGPHQADGWLDVDLDGDGRADRVVALSGRLPRDEAAGAEEGEEAAWYAAAVAFAGGPAVVFETSQYDPFFPAASHCFDLDGDGRAEVLVALGGECERTFRLVEWDGSRVRRVGFDVYAGD